MRLRGPLFATVLFLALGALPAQARHVRHRASGVLTQLSLGADDWLAGTGEFDLTLALSTPLARRVTIGGRFGALLTTAPTVAGVPLDLDLHFYLPSRLYIDLLGGPWILFTDQPVRAHAGFGFGLRTEVVSFGIEVGWLDPNALIGVRLGFDL